LLTFNKSFTRGLLIKTGAQRPVLISWLERADVGLFLLLLNLLELHLLIFNTFPQLLFFQKSPLNFILPDNLHAVFVKLRPEAWIKFIWIIFLASPFNLRF